MTDALLFEVLEGVATLTLNRPDRLNALNDALIEALLDRVGASAKDPEIGCVVLTGAGRGFCAGGDLRGQTEGPVTAPSISATGSAVAEARRAAEIVRILHEMPKPSIALVNGVAAGAGMSLALACDLRIGGQSARMTTAFARAGMPGDLGGAYFLNRLVGPAKARELCFTGAMVQAAGLERLGLVNRIVPDDDLAAEGRALAAQLARGPRLAIGYMKRNFQAAEAGDLAAYLDIESEGALRCAQSEDHQEAVLAFAEKREPRFRGR